MATTKPDKGNGVAILDRKLYDNAIQEIYTSKFEKLNEDQTLEREASLPRFLLKFQFNSILFYFAN